MNAYQEAKKILAKTPGRDETSLDQEIAEFAADGFVFIGPDYLLLGRQVKHAWMVHLAVGRGALKKFIELMPYYLPYIGWTRQLKGREDFQWFETERVIRAIKKVS